MSSALRECLCFLLGFVGVFCLALFVRLFCAVFCVGHLLFVSLYCLFGFFDIYGIIIVRGKKTPHNCLFLPQNCCGWPPINFRPHLNQFQWHSMESMSILIFVSLLLINTLIRNKDEQLSHNRMIPYIPFCFITRQSWLIPNPNHFYSQKVRKYYPTKWDAAPKVALQLDKLRYQRKILHC